MRAALRRKVAERALEGIDGYEIGCAYCGHEISVYLDDPVVILALAGWHDGMYCGNEPAHIDHIIPESRNGPNSVDNLVIVCPPCNLAKGDSPLGDPGFLRWLTNRRLQVAERRAIELCR